MSDSIELHSLGGAAPPDDFRPLFDHLNSLVDKPLSNLWEVLGPSLGATPALPREVYEEKIAAYSKLYEIDAQVMDAAVQAARFLLRRAAARNLNADRFASDLRALGSPSSNESMVELLMSGFETAKIEIREELLQASLFDHGAVLTGLDWRLDAIRASQRVADVEVPVTLFTFRYREGLSKEENRITLSLTPQVLAELRRACEHVESRLPKPATS